MSKNRTEEEHFERLERESLERMRARLTKQNVSEHERTERETHWHKCGKCGASMNAKTFRGVEIELCPRCGAVLLDPGELETIAGHESGFLTGIKAFFSGSGE